MTPSLPGWNSLELASRIASGAELAGIIFLGLLVLAEIIAFAYGHREVILREKAYRSEMEEANRRLVEVQKQQAQRMLSPEQRQSLVMILSPFRGQRISVRSVFGNDESERFARDFVPVFVEAGWDFGESRGPVRAVSTANPVGVEVIINRKEANAGRVPKAAEELLAALVHMRIVDEKIFFTHPDVPAGHIHLRVGVKVPTETESSPQ
jgi:hypothetical protein